MEENLTGLEVNDLEEVVKDETFLPANAVSGEKPIFVVTILLKHHDDWGTYGFNSIDSAIEFLFRWSRDILGEEASQFETREEVINHFFGDNLNPCERYEISVVQVISTEIMDREGIMVL